MKTQTKRAAGTYLILGIGILLIIYPLFLTVISAFKTEPEITKNFLALPESFYLGNFKNILSRPDYYQAVGNTLYITILSLAGMIVVLPMVSYSIARKMDVSPFYKYLYFFLLVGIFVPFQVKMMPLIKTMSSLHMLTPTGIIIVYVASSICEGVFLYVAFIQGVPTELEEAAYIDGASPFTTFIRIVYPLLKPPMVTLLIVIALRVWNNFMYPLLLLQGQNSRTLPLTVFFFKGDLSIQWNILFAATTLVILPLMIVYFILQKQIISGMLNGSVKG